MAPRFHRPPCGICWFKRPFLVSRLLLNLGGKKLTFLLWDSELWVPLVWFVGTHVSENYVVSNLRCFAVKMGAVYSSETLAQTYQTARSHSMTIRDFKTLTIQAVYNKEHWSEFVQPLLQMKSNEYYIFWECVYSLWNPAMQCNAHAPSCHL